MKTVRVAANPRDLTRSFYELWEQAEEAHPGLTRALTQNLVVVTDTGHHEELEEVISGFLARHPCRAFLLTLEEGKPGLSVTLCAGIGDRGKDRLMMLEKLALTGGWQQYPRLPNLIRPLLVNDIPTSLFWATVLPDDLGRIATMARLADRTIVDSTLFHGDDWRRLAELAAHRDVERRLVDLAWLRLSPWRRSLAEAFEHFDWRPTKPPTEVLIHHGTSYGSLGAARCLAHWIERKLGASIQLLPAPGRRGPANEPWHLDLRHGQVHVSIRHRVDEPRLEIGVTLMDDHCLLPCFAAASRGRRADLLAAAVETRLPPIWG